MEKYDVTIPTDDIGGFKQPNIDLEIWFKSPNEYSTTSQYTERKGCSTGTKPVYSFSDKKSIC